MSPLLLVVGTVLAAILAVLAGRQLWISWEERRARIERSALTRVEAEASTLRYRLDRWLRRTAVGDVIEQRLAAAGVPLSVLTVVLLVLAGLVGGFVVFDLLMPWWTGPVGSYLAWRGLRAELDRRLARRRDRFVRQLPELARTISNAVSAGRSLPSALRLAARELDDPAATEMATVAEELRIGQPLEIALERLAERLPDREVSVMVTTLLIQQRAGGDLVRALREMAATLDKRKDLRAELRTMTAGAVYTGYVVVALGVGAVLLVNSITPGALDEILSTWVGRVAVLASVGLYAVGVVLIRQQQSIEI